MSADAEDRQWIRDTVARVGCEVGRVVGRDLTRGESAEIIALVLTQVDAGPELDHRLMGIFPHKDIEAAMHPEDTRLWQGYCPHCAELGTTWHSTPDAAMEAFTLQLLNRRIPAGPVL